MAAANADQRHRILPKIHRSAEPSFSPGRVLVTWSLPSHRSDPARPCRSSSGSTRGSALSCTGTTEWRRRRPPVSLTFPTARSWTSTHGLGDGNTSGAGHHGDAPSGTPAHATPSRMERSSTCPWLMVASQRVLGCLKFLEVPPTSAILHQVRSQPSLVLPGIGGAEVGNPLCDARPRRHGT